MDGFAKWHSLLIVQNQNVSRGIRLLDLAITLRVISELTTPKVVEENEVGCVTDHAGRGVCVLGQRGTPGDDKIDVLFRREEVPWRIVARC